MDIKHLKIKDFRNGIPLPLTKITIREKYINMIRMNGKFHCNSYKKTIRYLNREINK